MSIYKDFTLDYEINNYKDFDESLKAVAEYDANYSSNDKAVTVKQMIEKVKPGHYDKLSRGDKCRVGRAVSFNYSQGRYENLERGAKKGNTNTYILG